MPGISCSRSVTSGAGGLAATLPLLRYTSPGTFRRSGERAAINACTSSTQACSPSSRATKSHASSASVRCGSAATWPPTMRTLVSGASCLMALVTADAPVMFCVDADGW
jgi:hypothetical protein